jgi:hypothetical protein
MIWLRRSFVLAPIGAFVAAALLLSCGGGGGSTPAVSGAPFSLMSLAICPGSPPTRTPTPKPTKLSCSTPTPIRFTPQCVPVETPLAVGTAAGDNTLQLNVQQTIQQSTNSRKFFQDVTGNGSLSWNLAPPGLINPPQPSPFPPGQLIGVAAGCACVTAQIGNIVSCPVTVAVGGAAGCTPCPSPSLCPGPTPTATRTPKPRRTCTPTASPTVTPTP